MIIPPNVPIMMRNARSGTRGDKWNAEKIWRKLCIVPSTRRISELGITKAIDRAPKSIVVVRIATEIPIAFGKFF
ncbi:MAG TPA: hypothetical protein VJK48_05550 [Chlamydiales bacterium]|nr:hypothetical protein [Chlamydiales bacterium]